MTAPDAIDSLWKDGGARRIELRPLSDDALEALVDAALDGPVEQSVVRRVVDGSAGNALYARELIVGALEEGRLTFDRGLWRLRRRAVSPSLAALVTRRMGALDDAQRGPLELLALGEPLRLSEIAALADLDILQDLEARGMVTVDPGAPDAVVRLAQPLYGEVLRAGLPVLRARALRLTLAETVARRSPLTPDDALRVARWRLDAGADVPPEHLLDAARAANLAGDPELGARLAQLASDAGLGLSATLLLSRAHIIRNRFADAEALLAAAEDDAPGDPAALGYIAQRVHVLFWGLGLRAEVQAFVDRAAGWSDDPQWPQRLDPWRLVISGFVEGLDRYEEQTGEAERSLADASLDPRARRQAELAHIFRLMAIGRAKDAHALVRRNRPAVPMRDNYDASMLGLMCVIELEAGEDWSDLEAYATGVLRDGVRADDHQAAGLAAFTLAALAVARGRYRDAERWVAEADGHFTRQDAFATALSVRALAVGIGLFTGDPARAREALAAVHAILGDGEPMPTQTGYLARAEGWGARALSDAAGADAFMAAAGATDQPNLAARLLYEALRAARLPPPWPPAWSRWRTAATRASWRRMPRTPAPSRPATARLSWRSARRWRRSAPTPTPWRRRSTRRGSSCPRAGRTPRAAPPPAPASCTPPARAPSFRTSTVSTPLPPSSPAAKPRSPPSPPAGCPIRRSPTSSSSPCAPSRPTCTGRCRSAE